MIQVDEVSPDWSVLLAVRDLESARLLAIILDGFGYTPLECRQPQDARRLLAENNPTAAVVDAGLDGAGEICEAVKQQGGIPLLLLLGPGEPAPEEACQRLKADGWERADSDPEHLLEALRRLADRVST